MPPKQTIGNLALAEYDDIFNIGKTGGGDCIIEIPLTELYPPELHPFRVDDDEAMQRLAISVKQYGVREPGLARPRADGGYELLSGNRRKRASELAGKTAMPIIVRVIDDINAALVIVDSNLEQREKILLSEKAAAYRMMMEALNHSGVKGESYSYEIMVKRTGESKNQIFRVIRLTELIMTLADKVDARKLAFNPAVELSYLSVTEQTAVADAMETHDVKPSLSQAVRLKKLKKNNQLLFKGDANRQNEGQQFACYPSIG